MTAPGLKVSRPGQHIVVTAPAEIDLINACSLSDQLTAICGAPDVITVDMTATTFCNSAGIRALARAAQLWAARRSGAYSSSPAWTSSHLFTVTCGAHSPRRGPGPQALPAPRCELCPDSTIYDSSTTPAAGADPVPLGSNNSGRGVGASMVHYADYTPRFHPSDFASRTNDGVGADWPNRHADLKPYYRDIEEELPVAGERWPWGDPHSYPHRPHPVGGNGEIFLRGARKAGITAKVGPVAITNGRFGNRPHCIYRGFCLQGCKAST